MVQFLLSLYPFLYLQNLGRIRIVEYSEMSLDIIKSINVEFTVISSSSFSFLPINSLDGESNPEIIVYVCFEWTNRIDEDNETKIEFNLQLIDRLGERLPYSIRSFPYLLSRK